MNYQSRRNLLDPFIKECVAHRNGYIERQRISEEDLKERKKQLIFANIKDRNESYSSFINGIAKT
jgi:hypothetical protein